MNTKHQRLVILLILASLLLAAGCQRKQSTENIFYTDGVWDIPPAYHGNPWAPGGAGVAFDFVYEPLFVYVPGKDSYIPRLGTSFTISDDNKTLTVNLRKDAMWHDGTSFTSRDVQTTFYLSYLRKLEIWRTLDDIECPDDYTIVFKWNKASPLNTNRALTEKISSSYYVFGQWSDLVPEIRRAADIIEKGDKEALKKHAKNEQKIREVLFRYHPELPIGTGPFKVVKVTSSELKLDKFKDHYEADTVKFDGVCFLRRVTNEVAWALLMSGDVDIITPGVPYDVIQEVLRKNKNIRLIYPSDQREYGLIFNCKNPPVSDVQFRRAIAHILDKDMIRQVAFTYGDTTFKYSTGIPKSLRSLYLNDNFFNDLTIHDHDPKKGEELLKKAGYIKDPKTGFYTMPDGKPINLDIIAGSGFSDLIILAEATSAQLSKFGISANVRVVPFELLWTIIGGGNYDMAAEMGGFMTRFFHPSAVFDIFYREGGSIQLASNLPAKQYYKGEEIDVHKLTIQLNNEMDIEKRNEIVTKLAYVTNEQLPFLSCYEKRVTIFAQEGARVAKWPEDDDPIWSGVPAGGFTIYCTLLTKGVIVPVGQEPAGKLEYTRGGQQNVE
jgi:peptide/nickel transport system substrate-binding protein